MKTTKQISVSTHRPCILVTLSHTERREQMEPKRIAEIFKQLFHCKSIVIAKEKHKEQGEHLHIAIHNFNASRYNAIKRIRQAFPQFDGMQCNIQFHKGLNNMLAYVTKEDKDPYVEGEIDKTTILEIAENARKKKRAGRTPAKLLIKALRDCQKWEEVYKHDELLERIVYGSHKNFKTIYQELQTIKESHIHAISRIRWYLNDRKAHLRATEYTPEELKEKYVLLDWIAVNLLYRRPLKTKQLLLYGEPSTQKTLFMQILQKALRIYFVGTRMNDFSGADDHYDLWVFDEYTSNEKIDFHGQLQYSEAATAYNRSMLRILDGQECRLDAKYSETFNKTRNVPIILIANEIPKQCQNYGPMQDRLMRLRFHNNIPHLDEERIIMTLMGCISRRVQQQTQSTLEQRKHQLLYNQEHATYAPINTSGERERFFKLTTEQGQELILKCNPQERTAILFVDPESYDNALMTTLKYALIPIEQQKKPQPTIKNFDALIYPPAPFHICRERDHEGMKQYLTWPVHLRVQGRKILINAEVRVKTTNEQKILEQLIETHGTHEDPESKLIIRIGPENEYTFIHSSSDDEEGTIIWTHRD